MPTDAAASQQWGIRLPRALLDRWRAAAEARGMTATQWQVYVMTRTLDGEKAEVGLSPRSRAAEKRHLRITLRADEARDVRRAAAREGHSLAGWVAMLIRARLRQAPAITGQEAAAVHQAAVQLMAIGRNINTAVRRLQAEGEWRSEVALMQQTRAAVRELQDRIDALQEAASRRGTV